MSLPDVTNLVSSMITSTSPLETVSTSLLKTVSNGLCVLYNQLTAGLEEHNIFNKGSLWFPAAVFNRKLFSEGQGLKGSFNAGRSRRMSCIDIIRSQCCFRYCGLERSKLAKNDVEIFPQTKQHKTKHTGLNHWKIYFCTLRPSEGKPTQQKKYYVYLFSA